MPDELCDVVTDVGLLQESEGEIILRNDVRMLTVGKEVNLLMPLVPLAKGMHFLESVLLVVKPLFHVEVLQQLGIDKRVLPQVLINIGVLQQVVFLGGIRRL